MRLRRKPWARPELAACPFFVDAPQEVRGSWASRFPRKAPIYLELGCGKGGFLAHEAAAHPEVNFIAIDLKSEVLALAKRKVEAALSAAGRPAAQVDNVLLMSWDIERLHLIFGEEERVDRVYVNFCNPWPKPGDHKHRLTHTRQLMSYRRWMGEEAELWFKTDDSGLFRDTLEQRLIGHGEDTQPAIVGVLVVEATGQLLHADDLVVLAVQLTHVPHRRRCRITFLPSTRRCSPPRVSP